MWCFLSSYLPRKPPGACQFSPWNGTVHFWATFLRSWSYEGPFNATKILQKGFATFRSFQNFLGSFQEAQITQQAEAIRYGPFQSLYGLLNQEFFLLTPVILQNCPGNFNQLICFLKGQNSKFELFKQPLDSLNSVTFWGLGSRHGRPSPQRHSQRSPRWFSCFNFGFLLFVSIFTVNFCSKCLICAAPLTRFSSLCSLSLKNLADC